MRTRRGGEPAAPEQEAAESTSSVPYPVTLVHDEAEDGPWLATIDALPGCTARGTTPDEAIERATEAMTSWLETAKREGKDVPEPKTSQSHSGRLLLRMPQTLHAELSRAAEREKVSLNQFITDVLAGSLGWRAPGARKTQVTRSVPALDGEEASPGGATDHRHRFGSTVFVVNGIVVALAAIVAIVVLLVVLTR
ncbi:MAG TPA: type II toxin-antitoxin system HicB family antitoxin [Gaiellaceae bacterium]